MTVAHGLSGKTRRTLLALVNPFRGVRYDLEKVGDLGLVCAPPYDIIDEDEKRRLEEISPYNSVRLILPDDEETRDRFAVAASRLRSWLEEGILLVEDRPCIYAYTMSYTHPARGYTSTRGIIAAVSLENSYSIVPHEKTLPKPLGEQLRLLQATRANLSPIYLLATRGESSPASITELASLPQTALGTCREPEGIEHSLSRIDDPEALRYIQSVTEGVDLLIADGHHRYEVALSYHRTSPSPGSDKIMALLVDVEEASHSVEGTHRIVLANAGVSAEELRRRFAEIFDGLESVPARPENIYTLLEENRVILVERESEASAQSGTLRAYSTLPIPRGREPSIANKLPASIAHETLLAGIPTSGIVFEPSLSAVLATLADGSAVAAVLLPPPPLEEIMTIARNGGLLPQKSTYFYPKPRTGAVFRLLDL